MNEDRVLLDTCIIQYLGSDEIKEEIVCELKDLIKKGKDLSVSYYTVFELLRGANKDKEKKRRETLEGFYKYSISPKVIVWAAMLDTLYRNDGVENGIDEGDKIIAATSISLSIPIITTNGQHFPRPFFDGYKKIIEYSKNSRRSRVIAVYFLSPDLDFLQKKVKDRK